MNSNKHKLMYHARKTKTLHNIKNVPISLHNSFQELSEFSVDDNGCVDTSTSSRESNIFDTHGPVVTDANRCSFHHSQECTHPSFLGDSQPLLAVQANITFSGNKNKSGCLVGESTYTKTCSDDFLKYDSSHTGNQIQISDNKVPCNLVHSEHASDYKGPLGDVGTSLQPQLADQNTHFTGNKNKNKTGSLDGVFTGVNITETLSYDSNCENSGDVIDVMDTALLEQDLYQKL